MTDVQICNLALARLGDARISSLSDATAQAQYCTLFYAQTVKELQGDYNWQFCRKQVNLSNPTVPVTGYSSKYALPQDFIRLVRLANIDVSENFGQWEIISSDVHTGLPAPLALDYIANITDPTKFPTIFVELLSLKLAAVLSMPLTGSKELFVQLMEVFSATLQKTAFLNSNTLEKNAPVRANVPISVTEICRQAILRVGTADLFKAVGEPMPLVQSLYEQTRDELLSDFQWSFARTQVSVTKDNVNPLTGYSFRYAIPANTKRILRVNNTDDSDNTAKWEIVGGFVHTDYSSPVIMDIITEVTDPTKFPDIFVSILTTTLALRLAGLIEQPGSTPQPEPTK